MLQLKITVEGLLALPSVNVWNVHGGLERLDRCIRHILKHRLKATSVCYLHFMSLFSAFMAKKRTSTQSADLRLGKSCLNTESESRVLMPRPDLDSESGWLPKLNGNFPVQKDVCDRPRNWSSRSELSFHEKFCSTLPTGLGHSVGSARLKVDGDRLRPFSV